MVRQPNHRCVVQRNPGVRSRRSCLMCLNKPCSLVHDQFVGSNIVVDVTSWLQKMSKEGFGKLEAALAEE